MADAKARQDCMNEIDLLKVCWWDSVSEDVFQLTV